MSEDQKSSRETRLKAALKANMGRRKDQKRVRSSGSRDAASRAAEAAGKDQTQTDRD